MDDLDTIREQNRWKPEEQQQTPPKPQSSLPKGTIALMTLTAIFFDIVQAGLTLFGIGLVASPFISVFAGCVFFVWFLMHGISLISPKRLAAMGGGLLTEIIPGVDILPVWTGAVWYTISTTKIAEVAEKIPGGKVIAIATSVKSGKKAA